MSYDGGRKVMEQAMERDDDFSPNRTHDLTKDLQEECPLLHQLHQCDLYILELTSFNMHMTEWPTVSIWSQSGTGSP